MKTFPQDFLFFLVNSVVYPFIIVEYLDDITNVYLLTKKMKHEKINNHLNDGSLVFFPSGYGLHTLDDGSTYICKLDFESKSVEVIRETFPTTIYVHPPFVIDQNNDYLDYYNLNDGQFIFTHAVEEGRVASSSDFDRYNPLLYPVGKTYRYLDIPLPFLPLHIDRDSLNLDIPSPSLPLRIDHDSPEILRNLHNTDRWSLVGFDSERRMIYIQDGEVYWNDEHVSRASSFVSYSNDILIIDKKAYRFNPFAESYNALSEVLSNSRHDESKQALLIFMSDLINRFKSKF
jgi:hypothetical protein